MSQARLNGLALLSINKDIANSNHVNFDAVVDEFAKLGVKCSRDLPLL